MTVDEEHRGPGTRPPDTDDGTTALVRSVSATITGRVGGSHGSTADLILSVVPAAGPHLAQESLEITLNETPLAPVLVQDTTGGRLHVLRDVPPGELKVAYAGELHGRADPAQVTPLDEVVYQRPSRYADADRMAAVAHGQFYGLTGKELVDAVTGWVGRQLVYVSGSSRPTDGAVDTFLARRGVCRDFAHLVIALLRAMGMTARLVSVYAPGLRPMDFHAVAEVLLDGTWYLLDATRLAPRQPMVRIGTGRDASDTAFLTVPRGLFTLESLWVTAASNTDPGEDPVADLVELR